MLSFPDFLLSIFFQNQRFQNILSGIPSVSVRHSLYPDQAWQNVRLDQSPRFNCLQRLSADNTVGRQAQRFSLHTSVYLLRTLIPSFVHDSAYDLHTFFTPH